MPFPVSVSPQWVRRARWFLGSLLFIWALAWLAVPPLAKRLIEEKGSQALGRAVTVRAVDFRPWSLELIVHDLAVASADGTAKQLEITRLYADAELESVLRLAPVLDAITVDTPTLRITHLGDGHYDFDDIVDTLGKAAANAPASAPLPFALYNLTLNGGAIDFTDHTPTGVRQHQVRGLQLAVPFLSTLESKRAVKVLPRLAFALNGSQFDTAAEGTPFAQTHQGDATLKITHLDLAPYLPYLPRSLPLRLRGAVVDADLRLGFEEAAKVKLTLAGRLKVSDLALTDTAGTPLLGVESVEAELADVRPLERVVHLASLTVNAPSLQGARNRAGQLNLALAGSGNSARNGGDATKIVASSAGSTGATGQKDSKVLAAPGPWSLLLERFTLHRGAVAWADDSTQPQARLNLAQLELQAQAVRWPLSTVPTTVEGSASMPTKGKPVRLAFKGAGSAAKATAHASVGDADLGLAAPYLAQWLEPGVAGVLDAELDATWQAGKQGDKPGDREAGTLQVTVPRLTVRDFALQADKAVAAAASAAGASNAERAAGDMPRFKLLEITDAQFDLNARTGAVGKVALRAPSAMLHRDAQGRWMVQRWLRTAATASATAESATKPPVPWQVSLGELAVDEGSVRLDDRSLARPARLDMSALRLQLKNAALDGSKPAPLTLSARLKSGRTEPGTLNYRGTLMWAPLALQGSVEALDLPLHAVAPYFAEQLAIAVLRADASYKGQLRYATGAGGAELQLQGDASLEDFRANTVAAMATAGSAGAESADLGVTEELLSWKSLNLPGIDLRMAPGAATRLQVRQATLSDFFARVIVKPDGRVNLQDLLKTAAPNAAAQALPVSPAASASASVAAPAPAPASPPAIIAMGPISLVNGKVLFSDRFIQPNYSADLSELSGKLGAFSSQAADGSVQLADLELRGRAEGTASLEISGKINPLAQPLAMNIDGHVRDLDLPPLTAYAVKYAGYGIERGKLSMDVNYTVQPDGQLTASNKLVLNQLSFGDAVKDAPNSLPVKLAVALLADRNGVIDLDLPISGSLNDPQFRIGAVVWKVITKLVAKALTAPFSLLAHAFGGGDRAEDLGAVDFAPGSSVLSPSAAQGLDQIAKALLERPALHVTVVGTASLDAERDALKRERLKALLLAEKRRRAVLTGQDAATATPLTDAEYPALLKDVYRRADIAKPRNIVGLAKDLPVEQMEALLLASIPVREEAMRELAQQRGVVVKDYLASRKLPAERLFLGAPKTGQPDGPWKPHAELGLTQR